MKKVIKKTAGCAVFLTGLVLLLTLASQLLQPRNNSIESGIHDVTANGILGEKENSIDVLILGDSESYSAFSPMEMWERHGFTSYACGTSGQRLCQTEQFLHQAFEHQKPRVVILETNAIYRKVNIKNWAINEIQSLFSVFRYHNRWKSLKPDEILSPVRYDWTDDLKGYSFSAAVNAAPEGEYMIPTEAAAQIPEGNREYVEDMAQFCRENGAQLLLVSTPSPVNWSYERHNGIQQLADEYGLDYIDMNLMKEEIPINWSTETRDHGDHLNYYGMLKATEFMGDYLTENYGLADHRQDERYARWNEALARYNMVVGKSNG